MLKVRRERWAEDDEVIDVREYKFKFETTEDKIHSALKDGWSSGKAKRHHSELIRSEGDDEGGLEAVFWLNGDLPVS